jgi:hypothetical protein
MPVSVTVWPSLVTTTFESSTMALRLNALPMRSATSLGVGSDERVMRFSIPSTPSTRPTASSTACRWNGFRTRPRRAREGDRGPRRRSTVLPRSGRGAVVGGRQRAPGKRSPGSRPSRAAAPGRVMSSRTSRRDRAERTLAYVIGRLAAAVPITAGGVRVVETTMTAALVTQGMTAGPAAAVVLAWRLISHWLPMVVGLIVYLAAGTGSGSQPAEPGAPTRGRRPGRRNDQGRAARILAAGTACQARPMWPSLTSRGGRRQPRGGRDRQRDRGAGVIAPFAPQVGVRSRPRGRPRRRRRAARPRPPRLGGCRSGQGCPRCSRPRRQRRCDASDRGGRPRAGGRRTR